MKKMLKKWAVLCGVAALLGVSCKKEAIETIETGLEQPIQSAQTTDDATIEKKVLAFKTKVDAFKNGRFSSIEEVPLTKDDAIFLMEATINYTYAFSDLAFDKIQSDSKIIIIQKEQFSSLIEFNEVATKYWETQEALKQFFLTLSEQDKNLFQLILKK